MAAGFLLGDEVRQLKGGCCVYEIAENPRTGKLQVVNVSPHLSIHNALHCGMLSVLDLNPVRRSASTVRSVFVLRYQTLQAHQAGVVEQVGAYLALFEVGQEDAVDAPVRCGPPGCIEKQPAAWKEKQRLSDEWIKTVPKTDYAAIALAGKLARRR